MKKTVIALSFLYLISPFFIPQINKVVSADTAYLPWGLLGISAVSATGGQQGETIIADGEGGAIVAWVDSRSGNQDIYAQKFNSAGSAQWTANGVAISTAANPQIRPQAVSDGLGGAIITWEDQRSGQDIYAQRIDRLGAVQWTANGIVISNAANNQSVPVMVSDKVGGAIISWFDFRAGVSNSDIYVQRIDSTGTALWTAGGLQITSIANNQTEPNIASDGASGAIVTWTDFTPADVYAQRINSTGTIQWSAGGVVISSATSGQQHPVILEDGSGGGFIAWEDSRSGNNDIYAQRINSTGTVQWTANGVVISNSTDADTGVTIATDMSGGAILTWIRNVVATGPDIMAQRINGSGTVQWTANGVIVTNQADVQGPTKIASDLQGGIYIIWHDFTRQGALNIDIMGQRLNSSGVLQWQQQGMLLSGINNGIKTLNSAVTNSIVTDLNGNVFLTWNNQSLNSGDVYIQKLDNINRLNVSKFSDQMTRINENTTATHTIYFVTNNGIFASQRIELTFPGAFTFGAGFDFGEIALAEGSTNNCDTATFTPETIGASPSGTTWGAVYSSSIVTITAATGFIPEARCVRVTLTSSGGTNIITNPVVGADTVYTIDIEAGVEQGRAAVIILNDVGTPDSDQIEIQGTVATSMSLDLDTVNTNCNNSTETGLNTVDLGTLLPGVVNRSDTTVNFICIDATSNAGLGMQIFARSNRNHAVGALVSGGNSIDSATADLNNVGVSSGYGLRVSSVGTPTLGTFTAVTPFDSVTPGSVGLLPGILSSAAQIIDSSAPVQTGAASRIAIEVAAKSDITKPPGSYSDIISFTALVNF